MADKEKRRNRSREEQKQDPRRVFSFRFSLGDERQMEARRILERWEDTYIDEHGVESPLPDIITELILGYEFGQPKPMNTEKRLLNLMSKRMDDMLQLIQAIAEREPVAFQEARTSQRQQQGSELDDDFLNDMLEDFNNTGSR